ncbi:MAG: hypothetical protein Q7V15_15760 [Phenylobacterium sp.]|uniref:hypothetical protein n=1 Tax=Phenylobacterium sp. TaxID=1871053 RepID=UPI0027243F8F|nr:hypothetical protein [Phenylobacterium sp.]MDO8902799.1 hypothetical protein [Phenylobacterium sp.]MDP2212313.1 hypothetical protein [Phenylobacterium sp.]
MARQLDFVGKSGVNYRYTALEDDRIPPTAGANYVIAETAPEGSRLLYAGETENVMGADLAGRLEEVRQRWPAAELLLRLNVRRAVRVAEREDLVAAHLPPLNDPPEAPSVENQDASPNP